MQPHTIETGPSGGQLQITWPDGSRCSIAAGALWSGCRSAVGTRRRLEGRHLDVPQALRITSVTPVGSYGVNIAFSDGHDRGIYPWSLLAELAALPKPADFIIDIIDAAQAGTARDRTGTSKSSQQETL